MQQMPGRDAYLDGLLACKVRLVRVVAPYSADRTLAHQVSQVQGAGA